jgi:hypothetical protein
MYIGIGVSEEPSVCIVVFKPEDRASWFLRNFHGYLSKGKALPLRRPQTLIQSEHQTSQENILSYEGVSERRIEKITKKLFIICTL